MKDVGIHLRNVAGGQAEWGIGKGTPFTSDWYVGNMGGYRCIYPVNGKKWLLGTIASGRKGWVRMDYLTLVTYLPVRLPD